MNGSAQEEVLAFLSNPASYSAPGPVERIDTHGAIVFLSGERAYKLKRAVSYPYLDYSTPELRRQACELELCLNRRTAPKLYLEVRSVNRSQRGWLTFGAGEAVDWLVVMRRFDQACLFDRLAQDRRLTPLLLRDLADRIAAFHATTEVTPAFGGADTMRAIIGGNRESMRSFPDLPQDRVDQLHRESLIALGRVAALLDRRRADARVRHCHGDLHLRNICLIEGEPVLFDCVEFSREIACIDVLYDLAFLLMDLWQRELGAETNLVFNRYMDMSEEAEGLAALPLFMSMRAAVRSHVGAAAADMQRTEEDRIREQKRAREYLALAIDLLRPRTPRLVAIGGLSGTGKTTLAQVLAPELGIAPGARVLRSDVIRKRLRGVAPETRLPETAYTLEVTASVYRRLADEARAALGAGHSAIVDAVFAQPEEREAISAVAASAGARFDGVWLEASQDVCEERVAARAADASDATAEVLRLQFSYQLGPLARWRRVDASTDLAAILNNVSTSLALG